MCVLQDAARVYVLVYKLPQSLNGWDGFCLPCHHL